VLVAKRLDVQMKRVEEAESGAGEGEKERELAKAALSVAELGMSCHLSRADVQIYYSIRNLRRRKMNLG
jgi:exopolyphosphatase/pppGpp-phosphohydrolase